MNSAKDLSVRTDCRKTGIAYRHDAAANSRTRFQHARGNARLFQRTHCGETRDPGTDYRYVRLRRGAPARHSGHAIRYSAAGFFAVGGSIPLRRR
jgi:hypothetical protein